MAIKKKTWIILGIVICFLVIITIIGSLILKEKTAEEEKELATLYIVHQKKEIRKEPLDSSEVIGQLERYETIRGVSEDEWIKCIKDNQTGYIKKSVLIEEANYPLHVYFGTSAADDIYTVSGNVINVSNDTFNYVLIEAIYVNPGGSVVKTDSKNVCKDDRLLPGGVKSFIFFGIYETDYHKVSVAVKKYQKVE